MISNIGSDIKSIDPSRLEDLKQINECREKTKLSKTNLTNLKGDSVHMIGMQFKYRAKNGMGALTIHNTRIAFFPSENRFSAKESKE